MPPWPKVASVNFASAVTITTTAETIVATLLGVNPDQGSQVIVLSGTVRLTTGTATTTVTLRIRRGPLVTSPLVGPATPNSIIGAAGNTNSYDVQAEDQTAEMANGTYVLTVQQASATGNGSAVEGELVAYMKH